MKIVGSELVQVIVGHGIPAPFRSTTNACSAGSLSTQPYMGEPTQLLVDDRDARDLSPPDPLPPRRSITGDVGHGLPRRGSALMSGSMKKSAGNLAPYKVKQ